MMIYLDYNATTPIDREVAEAMQPYLHEQYGNPSNSYSLGQDAKTAVATARQGVASLVGATPAEIVFTGCGSESNNMVIKGVAYASRDRGNHIITSAIEHPSVAEPLAFLAKQGYEITSVPVDAAGAVDPRDIESAIRHDTILVSIMHSNNEVGTLQPIAELGRVCRARGVPLHTDASQSMGKVPVSVDALGVDFLTLAGHKLYAPKGIGALYIRKDREIEPLVHGASQEMGRRAGTESVPLIVALGKAADLAETHLHDNHTLELKRYFCDRLQDSFGDAIRFNSGIDNCLPNTVNVSFIGMGGGDILASLPELCASTGSACHSGSKTISPVLKAMGIPENVAYGAIRFSLGRYSSRNDIDAAIGMLLDAAVKR